MHISAHRLHWFGLPSLIIIVLSVIAVAILLGSEEDYLHYDDAVPGLAPAVMVVVLFWILSITIVGAVAIAAHIFFVRSGRPQ